MQLIRSVSLLLVLLLAATSALAQEAKPESADRLAVADFEVFLVDNELGRGVAELLRSKLSGSGKVTLIERSQLVKVLEEQALQQSGIVAPEQAIETGRILGANKMVIGSVGKLGVVVVLNARVVDMESGSVERAWSLNAQDESRLAEVVGELAALLSGETPAKTSASSAVAEGATGYWASEWYDVHGKHAGSIYLQQSGEAVSGWTVEEIGAARISATMKGASIRGRYSANYGAGEFEFTLSADGQRLIGSYRGTNGSHGTWNAWRRPMSKPQIGAGAHVLADWSGDVWSYPGVISQVMGDTAHIAYDDGDSENLRNDRFFPLEFHPGDVIQVAQAAQSGYRNATVVRHEGTRLMVDYGDGQIVQANIARVRALRVRSSGY